MSGGEKLYLTMVLAAFAAFALAMVVATVRYHALVRQEAGSKR